jgi:hypothetical protein
MRAFYGFRKAVGSRTFAHGDRVLSSAYTKRNCLRNGEMQLFKYNRQSHDSVAAAQKCSDEAHAQDAFAVRRCRYGPTTQVGGAYRVITFLIVYPCVSRCSYRLAVMGLLSLA